MWDDYLRPASKVDYNLAIGEARKHKDKELQLEDGLELSPARKALRAANYSNQQAQGQAMKTHASIVAGGELEVGSVVSYALSNVDSTKVDPKCLTFVVVDKMNGTGGCLAALFCVANKAGLLNG